MFTTEGWYRVHGRGWVAIVRNDIPRDRSNPGLSGTRVMIDGEMFDCVGVELYMLATPIAVGERIGLHVRDVGKTSDH